MIDSSLVKLNETAKEIQSLVVPAKQGDPPSPSPSTLVIKIDFKSEYDAATLENIFKEKLENLDISVLINAANLQMPYKSFWNMTD